LLPFLGSFTGLATPRGASFGKTPEPGGGVGEIDFVLAICTIFPVSATPFGPNRPVQDVKACSAGQHARQHLSVLATDGSASL
jgi:hypothetical protein